MSEFRFELRRYELDSSLEPHALLAGCTARAPLLLDSAGGDPARFSLLAFDPLASLELPLARAGAGAWRAELAALLARARLERADESLPFAGGFLGALAYDLGVEGERLALPAEPWGFPLLAGGLYCDFLWRDEHSGRSELVLADGALDGRASVDVRRAAALAWIERARRARPGAIRATGPLVRHTSAEEHARRIERCREFIAQGECYQANLAHRFTRPLVGSPRDLYARLRAANRAPYMGYVEGAWGALLSASPELLLDCANGAARTRPIKGTLPRLADPSADAEQRARLLASEKDRAELAMIVDLERNDLGRVAEWGSVRVEGFPSLKSYARVHHLMADVVARPRAGASALDVLAALFPGGSITGAPKLRSMELVAELEREGRGFFCGALGLLDLRDRALFNILIRSPLWRARPELGAGAGEVSFRVGGGITWASAARAEDDETLAKALSLAEALEPD
ncbi:MAG: anthranilate synthase component I family protein [Planctomycetota bacterium]|nr:MAG: anthranilate synthase component I family protein [Planctomycetota bacterium]